MTLVVAPPGPQPDPCFAQKPHTHFTQEIQPGLLTSCSQEGGGGGEPVKSVTMLFFKTDFKIFPEREGEFEKRGKEQSSSKWEEKSV